MTGVVPTLRAIILMALGVPLGFWVAAFAPGLWVICFGMIFAILVLIFGDAIFSASARKISVNGDLPPVLFVGDEAFAEAEIAFKGGAPRKMDVLLETNDLLKSSDSVLARFQEGRANVFLPFLAEQRGRARVEALWLKWKGPLGLAEKHLRFAVDLERPVTANTKWVQKEAIRLMRKSADFGIKSQLDRGDGSEFDAMREFVPGMDRRSVDWKASARHQKLLAKEFRTEQNHNIVLAYDTGRLMCDPIGGVARLDRAVDAGLLLAYASLRGGDRVSLYGFDAKPQVSTGFVNGVSGFANLQSETTRLSYSNDDANYTLGLTRLTTQLRRRSLIILFTEFVDTTGAELLLETVGRLSKRHLILFAVFRDTDLEEIAAKPPENAKDVTRAVVADTLLQERRSVFNRLNRLGIEVLETKAESFGPDLLTRYLKIKREERI